MNSRFCFFLAAAGLMASCHIAWAGGNILRDNNLASVKGGPDAGACLTVETEKAARVAGVTHVPASPVRVTDVVTPVLLGRGVNVVSVLEIRNDRAGEGPDSEVASEGPGSEAASGSPESETASGSPESDVAKERPELEAVNVKVEGLPRRAVRDVSLMRYLDGRLVALDSGRPGRGGDVTLGAAGVSVGQLSEGGEALYVSIAVEPGRVRKLSRTWTLDVTQVKVDGKWVELPANQTPRRLGLKIRDAGDDYVAAYRIPGLATTNKGTLIAVYDVRHNSAADLQEDIDVGMSRSTDGGRTWEEMKIIMDMGEWGGFPQNQNGIGDPAVLVDETTGEIFVVAVWTHALTPGHAWSRVGDGFEPEETAQMMIVSSKDDGLTWSQPRNITRQVKQREWKFTLQGPGRGITMQDGTLVFPIQYVGPDNVPNAGIMYSKDHGQTWHCHGHAWTNTTEAQVAEVRPGVLMLNMRNNRRTGRIVCTTEDLGRTWKEHPSSLTLQEPVCMAGLLHVPAERNVLGRDVLLFSNPNSSERRNNLTIKASLDGGMTWREENSVLLDARDSWGYSCLTMIDGRTVGILYESSQAHLVFQAVALEDLVR